MILACPSCGARFQIDPALIGPRGRTVRCRRCQHRWHAAPTATYPGRGDSGAGVIGRLAAVQQLRGPNAAVSRGPSSERSRSHWLGWMIFAVVVAVIAAGLWFGRQQIVAAAPQAIRLYDLVGISVESAGTQPAARSEPTLTLGNVTSARRIVDGEPTLVIEGTIINGSEIEQPVPRLRAVLRDKSGASLAEWSFAAEADSLSPGETAGFSTTRVKPPSEATNLSVTLAGQPAE